MNITSLFTGLTSCSLALVLCSGCAEPVSPPSAEHNPEVPTPAETPDPEVADRLENINDDPTVPTAAPTEKDYQGTVKEVSPTVLTLTYGEGQAAEFALTPDVEVYKAGETVPMTDLKAGQNITVITAKQDDSQNGLIEVVKRIDLRE